MVHLERQTLNEARPWTQWVLHADSTTIARLEIRKRCLLHLHELTKTASNDCNEGLIALVDVGRISAGESHPMPY